MAHTPNTKRPSAHHVSLGSSAQPWAWAPPPLQGKFVSAIGSSFVEEFVIGHTHSDVLRELVQNEFDAGGNKLHATFSADCLTVTGNGRPIDRHGWERLSVVLGTGKVIGVGEGSREVRPKANGIGSKNFGLRSLFLFGDRIYVRSAGKMLAMDLPEVGTQSTPDPDTLGQRGVAIYVPYRRERFHRLEAFTPDREQIALDDMASELLSTLVKLALPDTRGLRHVVVESERRERRLVLDQSAKPVRCPVRGVTAIQRHGRLSDVRAISSENRSAGRFEEIEFQRRIPIPVKYQDLAFPGYFRVSAGSLRIGVSLTVRGNRIDMSGHGRFYYPLRSRLGSTGTAVSVNAPFLMDEDRSTPIECEWNRWLSTEAVRLTMDLLQNDWLERFGGQAYQAVFRKFEAKPAWFADSIEAQLKSAPCWPVRAHGKRTKVFKKASEMAVPDDPALDSFLSNEQYLDDRLASIDNVRTMVREYGATRFSLNSLVRLKCAPEESSGLATKLKQGEEANYYFTDYQSVLSKLDQQVRMASALTKLHRHLSKQNRKDLKETQSTLAADGSLQKASDLVVVDASIEQVCPVPAAQQLHPRLHEFRVIAAFCRPFETGVWIRQVAERIGLGTSSNEEREALYRYLLAHGATIDRLSLALMRKRPVVRDHRGNWTAPIQLVARRAAHFNDLEPVLHAPSRELERANELLSRLKIRKTVTGQDLVLYAAHVVENPALADEFEQTLIRAQALLIPKTVNQLHSIPFLRSSAGGLLAAPNALHLHTQANLACLEPADGFVGEGNMRLYRRLKCKEFPLSAALLGALARWRRVGRSPRQPEVFYPVLVASLQREGSNAATLENEKTLWVNGDYHVPDEVLVGPTIPRCFASALPYVRGPEALCKAYEALGAHRRPSERHWRDLILWFGSLFEVEGALPSEEERRALIEAYRCLGGIELPDGIPDSIRFLLSQDGTVHSLADLNEGKYVENDFPELADAILRHKVGIAFADLFNEGREFLIGLGLKRLTNVCQIIGTEIGDERDPPSWFHEKHQTRLLERIRQPEFVDAILALGLAFKRRSGNLDLPRRTAFHSQIHKIARISFVDGITRIYRIAGANVPMTAKWAHVADCLFLLSGGSLQEVERLLAFALAGFLGSASVEEERSLALHVLPLIQCKNAREIGTFLREQGISTGNRLPQREPQANEEEVSDGTPDQEDVSEQVVRQLLDGLETSRTPIRGDAAKQLIKSDASQRLATTPNADTQPVPLPTIDQVELMEVERTASWAAPTPDAGQGRGRGGDWSPPTPRDTERDREIGRRGEELIYRRELKRLRARGHDSPEKLVVWTSAVDAGADHDIRSVAEDGKPLWIEVKSTTGTDGRFDWPKNEFQKALREGNHYELWRIYEAHTERPAAKRFRDPVSLFGMGALRLDIGSLRAVVEPMNTESSRAAATFSVEGDVSDAK